MRTQGTYLAGIGVFRPEVVNVDDAAEQGLVPRAAAVGSGLLGVAVADQMPAPEMALLAAAEALKSSGLTAGDIGLLMCTGVWHQGPDGWGPQYYLQRHLLGDELLAVELRHGCNGTFSALELAVPYLHFVPGMGSVLIAASDNFGTPLINRWITAEGLPFLGDGASAVVLSRSSGFAELLSVCTATFSAMEQAHRAGEPLFPPGATTGTVLDFGARNQRFQQQTMEAGDWVRQLLAHQRHNVECTERALRAAEVTVRDIRYVLIHCMPRQAADSYLRILGFSLEQSTWDFARTVGHLGAGDHLTALHHLITAGRVSPGDNLLLCGFSPGVTYKAAVIRILDAPLAENSEASFGGI